MPPAAAAACAEGAKIPITQPRVTTRPGEHPLPEFMHPALGIVGLGCWIAFVITRFRVFAWVALGVIVVTIAAGVIWYVVNARPRKAGGRHPARRFASPELLVDINAIPAPCRRAAQCPRPRLRPRP